MDYDKIIIEYNTHILCGLSFITACMLCFLLHVIKTIKENYKPKKYSQIESLSVDLHSFLSSRVDLSIYEKTINAIEKERERIGSDIHDDMTGKLTSIHVELDVVYREQAALSPFASDLLFRNIRKVQNMTEQLENIIEDIVPSALANQSIGNSIKQLCNKYNGVQGSTVLFKVVGTPLLITHDQKVNLYRIAQELLNNCFKHSMAWTIFVTLFWDLNGLKLIVKDNGIGMPAFFKDIDGHGLTGILIRSNIINASAKYNQMELGTEFEITLPIDQICVSN